MAQEFCSFREKMTCSSDWALEDECFQLLMSLPISPKFFTLTDLLFKDLSLPVVQAALDRLLTAGAPRLEGIPASIFLCFFDVFSPKLLEEMQLYENGASPSYDLLMGLMYMIPKTRNSVVVSIMRLICVGNTCLGCISLVLVIQVEDVLAQLVHPMQVGSIKGIQMQNHLWSLPFAPSVRLCPDM